MILDEVWTFFNQTLFPTPSTPSLFNPYHDNEPDVDLPHGDEIRRKNLLSYLRSFSQLPALVLIGEAPGWRGCRFSGVPFTSESQLVQNDFPFCGNRSSLRPAAYSEATATIFWRHLSTYHPHFFVWNCIPFHPRKAGDPLSNRTPSRREIETHSEFLSDLLSLFQPAQVIALGRSAQRSLAQSGVRSVYVRHPSRGGAWTFWQGMASLLQDSTMII